MGLTALFLLNNYNKRSCCLSTSSSPWRRPFSVATSLRSCSADLFSLLFFFLLAALISLPLVDSSIPRRLLKDLGLTEYLNYTSPITIFAPINAAFEGQNATADLLKYHIVTDPSALVITSLPPSLLGDSDPSASLSHRHRNCCLFLRMAFCHRCCLSRLPPTERPSSFPSTPTRTMSPPSMECLCQALW